MGDKGCQLQASVTEEEVLNDNSRSGSNKLDFAANIKQEVEAASWNTGSVNDEFAQSIEELFINIPELKDIFHVRSKIGEGTFSNVYLAHLIEDPDELFALKYIIPTSSPERVEREVRCLQQMGGLHNVVGYKGTLRNRDHSAIILPYFSHDRFQEYLTDLTVSDICDYMKNLLQALKHIHSFSIIHRDIKPGNFLHSRTSKRYNLVDFGLAMHEPGSEEAWDIEKKKNDSAKTVTKKNVRVLSPESCKTGQVPKKPRTSPRFAPPSHKLTRQASTTSTKSSFKSSLKNGQVSQASGHKQGDGKHTKVDTKVDTKVLHRNTNGQQRTIAKGTTKSTSGLCQTNHKKIDVCSLCMKRSTQNAPRAGTSGFRAPEVLMKHPHQTTAVDVWSAGVIMLCLLSGRYPFFRCYDDLTALAQIISLFGKQRLMDSSKHVGKYIVCNSTSTGFQLKNVCQKLRLVIAKEAKGNSGNCCKKCTKMKATKQEKCLDENTSFNSRTHSRMPSASGVLSNGSSSNGKTKVRFLSTGHSEKEDEANCDLFDNDLIEEHLDGARCTCVCGSCSKYVPQSAYELLERLLDLNPGTRITASEALNHPFFTTTRNVPLPER